MTADLVVGSEPLSRYAINHGISRYFILSLMEIQRGETGGELTPDTTLRAKEAYLLALASLSSHYQPIRVEIAEADPNFLPILADAVRSPSYGLSAAACQLVRSLSRNIAILRTNLLDQDIGPAVLTAFKNRVEARAVTQRQIEESADRIPQEDDEGDRAYTVEIAAIGVICNLIADFSPFREEIVERGILEKLCELAQDDFTPLAHEALWALKNFTYRATESSKQKVINALGYPTLLRCVPV